MAMTLIATNPDSTDVASMSFTSGIDNTYKLFIFKFTNLNPATDAANFMFQSSTDGGSNYNVATTSSFLKASHTEAGTNSFAYDTGSDAAQSTSFIKLVDSMGNDADSSCSGEFHLFNPSSSTYATNFYSRISMHMDTSGSGDHFCAGYINTTSAVDAIQFKMNSGNFDGTIKMYGVG